MGTFRRLNGTLIISTKTTHNYQTILFNRITIHNNILCETSTTRTDEVKGACVLWVKIFMVVLVASSWLWLYWLPMVVLVAYGCMLVASSCPWLYWLPMVVH
jgi:hypothetical protein